MTATATPNLLEIILSATPEEKKYVLETLLHEWDDISEGNAAPARPERVARTEGLYSGGSRRTSTSNLEQR